MSTLVGGPAPQRPIPRNPEIKRFLYENAIIGETRRFRQLNRYESFYACTHYNHLTHDWWGMSADQMETVSPEIQVPYGFTQPALGLSVRVKRPTSPFNLCKAAVDRFTGLLFSESRRPEITVEGDAATEDFLLAAMEQMRFWPKMREARTMGGALGSVMVTVHLRDGRFCLEVHNPKHCQIVWKDRRTLTPMALLTLYKYTVEEDVADEKTGEVKGTRTVEYLYRRILTENDDTVYKAVRLEPGATMDWIVESEVVHNLGFFPGVWIQNLPVLDQEDGDPDCHGAWQGFDLYDRIVSQMNKAVLLNLDPTPVISVDPKVVSAQGGILKGSDNALMVGTGGNAHYMEITGSGVDAGMKLCDLTKQNILTVIRCVLVDPATISGAAQSAKAIEYIYAPMLEKADDLRAQYGDLGVLPLLLIIEKIARKFTGTVNLGEGKIGKYEFNLPPKKQNGVLVTPALGPGGYIRIKWGAYFTPTEDDKQKAVATVAAAKGAGLIDAESAIKQIASVFDIRDTAAVFAKVKAEQEAEMSAALGDGGPVLPDEPVASEPPPPAAGEGGKP
jgi:hypothetical protein